jgi:tungstate transport system substrate-binding protein
VVPRSVGWTSATLAALALAIVSQGCGVTSTPLVLATTTSVGNSGLLEVLTPAARHDLSVDVRAHLVGSGLSLRMLEEGLADVVISHAPEVETTFLARHADWSYRKLMFNDFVIVGPAQDPARVSQSHTAADAMQAIARSRARFASRADSSGTFEREQRLWADAGVRPEPRAVIGTAQGMAATLRVASSTGAYTLTDRATFAQLQPALQLKLLFENDPVLLNTYAVVVPASGAANRSARAFAVWLASGRGRELIANFRIRGAPAFRVWPEARVGTRPTDLPR